MKINRLIIENFRNHKKTEINMERINFFAGHNNAGKTSILAAIEWALTGRCIWTDKAGRGAADLVRQGEKQAAVALDVEGLGVVVRSLPPHSLQVERASGVNEGQAAIYNYLGVDESRLQVAFNAGAFLAMSQAEQRAFLFSAYGLSWTAEQVAAELARWLAEKKYSDEEAQRLAAKARGYYPAGVASGPEIFEAMEKRAKEERRELKKDKQQIESALDEIKAASLNQVPPEGLEDLKNRLAGMKKRRDEMLKACGASREAQARRQALEERSAS
ncbi:MAG: AAA family ATPase [Peptococcaceae bacterium MAG4]|nr:AAA family ATPase [Peptococcaceae bacterium MAG4]